MTVQLEWQAEDVVRAVHGQCLHEQSWKAQGVSIDSRTTKVGDLFVALKGPAHDGHDHVAAAFDAGAVAAIVAKQPSQVGPQAPLIIVDDTFTALENLGRAGRARSTGHIVAVTGSVGKTSTKEMLRLILGAVGSTYANEGSFNNHWGVPLSLSRLPANADYGVFEMGMNHAGELGPLSQQVQPHVALITTIEAVHLEFFASLDAIADAKSEIFLGLKPDGTVILNRDNPQFGRLASAAKTQGRKKILGFGKDGKADARLLDYNVGNDGSQISADIMGQKINYWLSSPGVHIAMNSLGALLAAISAGGDLEACAYALAHYHQPKGRGVIETLKLADGDITIIDESYNASPVAVRAAIRVLSSKNPTGNGRRILVLGDMKELGTSSPALHADLAKDIAEANIACVYCCGEMMGHLYAALPQNICAGEAKNSCDLAPLVASDIRAGDIVTVKGSHSMQMERVVDALKALGTAEQKLAS